MVHIGQDVEEHRVLEFFVRVHQPLDTENDELVVGDVRVTVEKFSLRALAHRIDAEANLSQKSDRLPDSYFLYSHSASS